MKQRKLPLLGVAALLVALPSAGMAVVGLDVGESRTGITASDFFTPAVDDPDLAARVAEKARERGIRFTPVGAIPGAGLDRGERTVTVAVRIDEQTAQAIQIRTGAEGAAGKGAGVAGLQASRFNLGTARGYQSFARQPAAPSASVSGRADLPETLRANGVRNMSVPDLAEFEPARPTRDDKPSRLQPRIELEDEQIAGRSPNTLASSAAATVDVGGAFRVARDIDVTAGVRYSQERDRLDPLTNSVQDSQAVYVGTQIRF